MPRNRAAFAREWGHLVVARVVRVGGADALPRQALLVDDGFIAKTNAPYNVTLLLGHASTVKVWVRNHVGVAGADDLEHPYFRAALVVTSSELSLAELTQALGREPDPDGSRDIGDMLGYPVRPATHAWWSLELDFDDDVHRGCYGLTDAIVGLGDELADRILELAPRIAKVALSVEQHLDPDDVDTDGIHLEAPAIAWLARVGGYVDIDQYAKEANFRDALRGWGAARMWNLREIRWDFRRKSRIIPVVRRLVPVGDEERDEPRARVWRGADNTRRDEARRLWESLYRLWTETHEHTDESIQDDWMKRHGAAGSYLPMLSLVAKGGRANKKALREACATRAEASTPANRWPDHWGILAEVDSFLSPKQ